MMTDPSIRTMIEALPLCEDADVEALTAKLAKYVEEMKSADDKRAKEPSAKATKRQSLKLVTAIGNLNAALTGLHEVTRDFIWEDISAEVDDLGRYVTPDEIKALLAPLRQSAQRLADHKAPSGNRLRLTVPYFTSVLVELFEESTGHTASDDKLSVLQFVSSAFAEAGLAADPDYYFKDFYTRHPGA